MCAGKLAAERRRTSQQSSQHPGPMKKRLPNPKARKPRHVKAEGQGFEP